MWTSCADARACARGGRTHIRRRPTGSSPRPHSRNLTGQIPRSQCTLLCVCLPSSPLSSPARHREAATRRSRVPIPRSSPTCVPCPPGLTYASRSTVSCTTSVATGRPTALAALITSCTSSPPSPPAAPSARVPYARLLICSRPPTHPPSPFARLAPRAHALMYAPPDAVRPRRSAVSARRRRSAPPRPTSPPRPCTARRAGRDAARAYGTGCFKTHHTHDLRGLSESELRVRRAPSCRTVPSRPPLRLPLAPSARRPAMRARLHARPRAVSSSSCPLDPRTRACTLCAGVRVSVRVAVSQGRRGRRNVAAAGERDCDRY